MKKNYFYLLVTLVLFACTSLQAQVTIGGLTKPVDGTILDLNSPGGARGGLVLSNIAITDLSEIPANELLGISSAQGENEYLRGTMVYNTGTANVPAGIYVWNGYCWTPDGNCTPIFTTPSIRAFAVSAVEHADLEVTADGCPELTYTWYKSAEASTTGGTPINNSNLMTYQTPTGLAEGIHYYYCTVKSDYSNVVVTSDLFTVTVCLPPAQPGTIDGPTSVTSGATGQIYSVEAVSGATSYEWTLPSGWNVTAGTTTRSITVTAGTSGRSISVKAKNSCGSSAEQILAVTVVCPGYTITNGAYSGPTTSELNGEGTTMDQLTDSYGFSVSGDLCLAPADQGSPSTYNWPNAKAQCDNLGDDWRLPNIAELGNLQSSRTSYGMDQFRYWSSTEWNSTGAWYWYYNHNFTYWDGKSLNRTYARCVRSL
jgi:hypothetical protein